MKNTKREFKEMIWNVQDEIKTMKTNLKNSKNYLQYLQDCLKHIEEEEQKEKETPEQRECEILFNKWVQGDL